MTRQRAVWVSTSTETRGGIATFVRTMQQTALWTDWNIQHIATHHDGSVATRILAFARGAVAFTVTLLLDRPDVVHIHTASNGSFVRKATLTWIGRAARVPVVLHLHGGEFDRFHDRCPRPLRRVIRATLENADAVVALGGSWRARLARIAPSARIIVVPNAVRPQRAVDQRPSDHEPVNVVFLGDVLDRKGTFLLLDAWAKIVANSGSDRPGLLTIAGDGEVERARTTVASLGLHDSVRVVGWLPHHEASELLDRSQILVLPSRAEGQPMAILEAMARGLCVVASDVGGIPDLIDDTCAVVVPVDDLDRLTCALSGVLHDHDSRRRLGASAWQRVADEFDADVVSRRFDALYREVRR
ncbi:glycosyltransferase family 4 protein [Rhodococcus koreensis]|uniref:glycosyltransferase family 4 protein n=1 Tax=Rhodococcus koreensis TaxID=99653 RepID=UPI0036D979C6